MTDAKPRDDASSVVAWLKQTGSQAEREGMLRYGIPNDRAFGVSMGALKRFAKPIGRNQLLANALWDTGWYEARALAAFVAEPGDISTEQADQWVADFDNWAICDTVCFHLFDRLPFAWDKVERWANDDREFVRRAGFALVWGLTVHDKTSGDGPFVDALRLIQTTEPDERPLVKKAVNMALRAIGKRNCALNTAALATAAILSESSDPNTAWVGRHAARELGSEKVRRRLQS